MSVGEEIDVCKQRYYSNRYTASAYSMMRVTALEECE